MDVVILMDCTGSMGSWIQAAKETATKTAAELRASMPGARFRLGFLGYRDHCDTDRFVKIALSEDVDAVKAQMMPVAASGGGDEPEDVAGGLRQTLDFFDWAGDVKLVMMVADAPAHGKEYNDSYGDSYPEGDPDGHDPKALVELMAKRGMDFTFIRCSSTTGKMIAVLSAAFERGKASEEQAFTVVDLQASQGGGGGYGGEFSAITSMPIFTDCEADMLSPPPPPPPGGIMPVMAPCIAPPLLAPAGGPSYHRALEMESVPMASMSMAAAGAAPAMPMMARSMAMPSAASASYGSAPSTADSLHSALTASVTRSVAARRAAPRIASDSS